MSKRELPEIVRKLGFVEGVLLAVRWQADSPTKQQKETIDEAIAKLDEVQHMLASSLAPDQEPKP